MEQKKRPRYRTRLVFLYIGSFLISILPLLVCLLINWNKYVSTPSSAVKLSLGAIILLTIVFIKVIGKLKMPPRVVSFGVVFIMAYLLQAILNDLILLSGMALVGEFIDYVAFQRAIKVTKENILIGKTADVTTNQIEAVLQKYINNGRV